MFYSSNSLDYVCCLLIQLLIESDQNETRKDLVKEKRNVGLVLLVRSIANWRQQIFFSSASKFRKRENVRILDKKCPFKVLLHELCVLPGRKSPALLRVGGC